MGQLSFFDLLSREFLNISFSKENWHEAITIRIFGARHILSGYNNHILVLCSQATLLSNMIISLQKFLSLAFKDRTAITSVTL